MSEETTLAQATAAPAEIRLAGKTYRMSPLTWRDHAEIDLFIQTKVLQIARAAMADPSWSERERSECWANALKQAATLTWMSEEGQRSLFNFGGLARLVWHGIRRNHPTVTVDQVADALADPQTLAEATDVWHAINDAPGGGTPKKAAG